MIQNISHQKQYEVARLKMIAEENIKANRLRSEIIAKINELCQTSISKKSRTDKIKEITKHIELNSSIYIDLKGDI
jgi:hypothetical protein